MITKKKFKDNTTHSNNDSPYEYQRDENGNITHFKNKDTCYQYWKNMIKMAI